MPLIKIDGDRFINSDKIEAILPVASLPSTLELQHTLIGRPLTADDYLIILTNCELPATPASIAYITQTLDTDENFTTETVTLSLKSRIAILLRNQAQPLTAQEIANQINAPLDYTEANLNELLVEHVIRAAFINEPDDLTVVRYSHAATGAQDLANTAEW